MRHYTQIMAVTAATLIVSGCNLIKGNETAGQAVDDATLLTRAKASLVKDSTVSASDFNIDVYKGDVTLSGVAKNPGELDRAISDIKAVPGVRSVKSAARVATKDRGDEKSQ